MQFFFGFLKSLWIIFLYILHLKLCRLIFQNTYVQNKVQTIYGFSIVFENAVSDTVFMKWIELTLFSSAKNIVLHMTRN
jgi:hypothetical protein